jgi:hypothetical protein
MKLQQALIGRRQLLQGHQGERIQYGTAYHSAAQDHREKPQLLAQALPCGSHHLVHRDDILDFDSPALSGLLARVGIFMSSARRGTAGHDASKAPTWQGTDKAVCMQLRSRQEAGCHQVQVTPVPRRPQ